MSSQNIIKQHYETKVVDALKKSRGYKNQYQIPKIEKVVLNMGIRDRQGGPGRVFQEPGSGHGSAADQNAG